MAHNTPPPPERVVYARSQASTEGEAITCSTRGEATGGEVSLKAHRSPSKTKSKSPMFEGRKFETFLASPTAGTSIE